MNAARAQVSRFKGIVLREHVLHTEVPLNRVGKLLVRNVIGSAGDGVSAAQRSNGCVRRDPAALQKTGSAARRRAKRIRVDSSTELRGKRENTDVVVQNIVSHAEARPDGSIAAGARRKGDSNARREVVVLRLRFVEHKHARGVGDVIEPLKPLRVRHARELVPEAEIQREVRLDAPGVVDVRISGDLIAVINDIPNTALGEIVRREILQVQDRAVVVVLAARALRERSGADGLSTVKAELESVPTLGPGHVVGNLIRVLNRELRGISIGPDVQVQVVQDDVREHVKPGEFEIACRRCVVEPVVAQTELVREIRSEVMILGQGCQIIRRRQGEVKLGKFCRHVDAAGLVIDKAAA